ncbi:MAG TPA: glycogen synthase GlgA [Verrucomicrobiae bacterium]|nr:glycogen synthase GlgA [Verrucomicrobiae bacterium]
MARVLMVSSEAAPFAKTGGLADVVGVLPEPLRALGNHVGVVIPRYGSIDLKTARRIYDHLALYLGTTRFDVTIYQGSAPYPLYLVDCPKLYDRPGLYGESGVDYPDNHLRFAVLARGALAIARYVFRTEIFHCHDWQSGLVPAYLHTVFASDPTFLGVKTLFTIHNLGYQGLFPRTALSEIGLADGAFRPDGMEFFGRVSYIKGGISFADALSTVSPTYAREIQTPEFGFGLDGALSARADVLTGILNGVDYTAWDPATDPALPAHYSVSDLAGKRVCKEVLLREFSLPAAAMDRPLLGIVSRFTRQKGSDLLSDIVPEIVSGDAYLVALGTGDPEYEEMFQNLAASEPDRIAIRIGFDDRLAHLVEAGSDIFLMPSRYEPCGLNQMYSLRYGTVPVVRATGGLDDTIDEGTGFKFHEYSGPAFAGAVRAALAAFSSPGDGAAWQEMMRRGMRKDFSWNSSAAAYSALYEALLGR